MHSLLRQVIDLNMSNLWFLSFVTTFATLLMIIVLRTNIRRKRIWDNLPGSPGYFIIGDLLLAMAGPEKIIDNGKIFYRTYEKSLFKGRIFNHVFIFLTQPEDIEFVLNNPKLRLKSREYSIIQQSIMGEGIFTISDMNKWKHNRKMVSGGFSYTMLKLFISIFFEEANVLNRILQKNVDSESNDCEISKPVSLATMEIIGRTGLDVKFDAQNGGSHPFVESLHNVMHVWEYRITHPWFLSKTLFRLSSLSRKHDRSQLIINQMVDDIIKNKLHEFIQNANNKNNLEENNDEYICRKPKSVVEILIENYHEMSHKQIRDEIVTIMIGGQETTAMANTFALFMLAHHQDAQNKVFEELQSIFHDDDPDRSPTFEDLQRMEYLERVIKETLRLFPPLPIFARHLVEDMQIGKHLCPAGASLVVCPLFLQSSPLFYTDPDKFNPDNFLPDAVRSRNPYTYLPFSAGQRNCIGTKYAMLQMKTVLSTIVRRNKLSPSAKCASPKDLKLMFLTTLKVADGCHINISPRT